MAKYNYTRPVKLESRFDKKTATVRAYQALNGTLFVKRSQIRRAERRARIVSGDYFLIPETVCVEETI